MWVLLSNTFAVGIIMLVDLFKGVVIKLRKKCTKKDVIKPKPKPKVQQKCNNSPVIDAPRKLTKQSAVREDTLSVSKFSSQQMLKKSSKDIKHFSTPNQEIMIRKLDIIKEIPSNRNRLG